MDNGSTGENRYRKLREWQKTHAFQRRTLIAVVSVDTKNAF